MVLLLLLLRLLLLLLLLLLTMALLLLLLMMMLLLWQRHWLLAVLGTLARINSALFTPHFRASRKSCILIRADMRCTCGVTSGCKNKPKQEDGRVGWFTAGGRNQKKR